MIGAFNEISLQEARERAFLLRLKIEDGIDPIEDEKQRKEQEKIEKLRAIRLEKIALDKKQRTVSFCCYEFIY